MTKVGPTLIRSFVSLLGVTLFAVAVAVAQEPPLT